MAERKYQFEGLTPTDNVDLDVYEDTINYVLINLFSIGRNQN